MSTLEQTLTSMEKSNALLENTLRNQNVSSLALFQKEGTYQPASFKTSETLLNALEDDVKKTFPSIAQKQANQLLECIPSQDQVTGKKIAVLFSGGPASGGHNVVAGIKAVLGAANTLYGVKAGPKGLIEGDLFELNDDMVAEVLNLGGFDLLGSDRTKIKTPEQFEAVKNTVKTFNLDGIIVVGGDDSNTNAAFLAENLAETGCSVIGVPKTIDGDLQIGALLPISFGFDTATKIYSEMVGNILQDTPSSRKYWHFVKLMGRSASHVALEVALQTRPQLCFISEEVAAKKMSLNEIISECVDVIVSRSKQGKDYGVVLIPEGLIEFIPELKGLMSQLNDSIAQQDDSFNSLDFDEKKAKISPTLSSSLSQLFNSLPNAIQQQLLLERDSHGNVQVSQIPTELLLIEMIQNKLKEVAPEVKFSSNRHFFGYEGRCGAPSLFDSSYTFNLGLIAGSLAARAKSGYIAALSDLSDGGKAYAIPIPNLVVQEKRHGTTEMVIKKALVEMDSKAFKYFQSRRKDWAGSDKFTSPGPRQFWGPVANQVPFTVALNQGYSSLNFDFK
ncbi:diphosphate--fructose-6-phosphate 1-phosphotransferase [Candidatus Marinamargulisbacteria bacterium SCGC AAA071-K20]|nr:diphosphate--fructose-6-phosphate 1-phosphotransferase [Candidatus Marinamargulisbacteria bacterium SCGC AAA071-K20]